MYSTHRTVCCKSNCGLYLLSSYACKTIQNCFQLCQKKTGTEKIWFGHAFRYRVTNFKTHADDVFIGFHYAGFGGLLIDLVLKRKSLREGLKKGGKFLIRGSAWKFQKLFPTFLAPTGSPRSHFVCLSVRLAQSALEQSFFIISAQIHLEHIRMTSGWLQDD